MPAYGFADQAEFDRARRAIRAMEEFLRRGQDQEYRYESPAATVVVKANGDIDDGGSAPSETGVYACRVVFRDFTVTDPDAAGAWVEVSGARWCEAYAPNKEALVVGKRYRGRFVGYSTVSPFRPRVEVTSVAGGASPLVAVATAANNGSQWTTGLVQRFTSTGDLTAASPFEVVELKPLHESERLVSGQPYLCVDTGVRGSGGRRRLRAERLGGAGSPGGFREITVVTSVSCIGDAVHATIDRAYAPPATP